jgi:cobalt-zinc-cadmium efflux system outer membrane protein
MFDNNEMCCELPDIVMNFKSVVFAASACFALMPQLHAADTTTENRLSLADVLEITLANNQGLAGTRSQAEALAAVPSQQGALPDPMLGLNAVNLPTDTFDLDQEPMTQMQISLSQKFPWPGQRGLQHEAATKDAEAATKRIDEQRLQISARVRATWWQLMYLDQAIEIIDQNQNLMRDFVEIAETKYKVGKGLQQDVLLAQLELSRLINRQLPIVGMRNAAEADLNALMDRPPSQTILPASESANINLPALPPGPELLEQALANRPLLNIERDKMEAARLRVDVARTKAYPDFTVGAAYGFRDGSDPTGRDLPDLMTFRLGFNLPIYSSSKQDKAIEQRSSNYFTTKHVFNESLRTIQSDVTRYHAYYNASRDQVSLYGSAIIPQAQQTVSAMLSAYQVNKVDFLNVLNAQLVLYNAQISYWEAMSNAKRALANLAATVGSESLYE